MPAMYPLQRELLAHLLDIARVHGDEHSYQPRSTRPVPYIHRVALNTYLVPRSLYLKAVSAMFGTLDLLQAVLEIPIFSHNVAVRNCGSDARKQGTINRVFACLLLLESPDAPRLHWCSVTGRNVGSPAVLCRKLGPNVCRVLIHQLPCSL
ncbi:hypothetical protein BDZ89DRAFT_196842 [Hymenopellis radicata]|nr:hypothetical protein BDZ89DRAFT_196842 [Hymenopellis radicata]